MLKSLSRNELIEKLRKLGFNGPYSASKHQYMIKSSHKIFIPNPHGKDIGLPIIKKIILQIGISKEEFFND
jgi:hypothetical protein